MARWLPAVRPLQLLGGEDRPCVGGASGNIGGVVIPGTKNRRSHWVGSAYPEDADAWLTQAAEHKGSWWPRWSKWLDGHGGGKRKAPARAGNAKYKPIESAPGRYVRHRIVH